MQSIPNPFLDDAYARGVSDSALGDVAGELTIEPIHEQPLRQLGKHLADLTGRAGAVVLLRSARAGFGKSHLLARLGAAHAKECFFVPLDVNRDSRPNWTGMLQGVLTACSKGEGSAASLSFLDCMGRKLMGEAAAELILRGDIPTANPAVAITMLKRDYLQAFDMRGGSVSAEVSRWMACNFSVLLPLMGEVLGSRAVVDKEEAVAWLRVLARFNAGDDSERKAALDGVTVFGEGDSAQAGAKQRLRSFCRLATLDRPLVLVFDHLDALWGGKKEAMTLACMVGEMGRLQFGSGVLLSVNGDIWSSVFNGHLPGAVEDRLTAREVPLAGIAVEEAESLIRLRLDGASISVADANRFVEEARLPDMMDRRWAGAATPREVLRHGATVWERLMTPRKASDGVGEPKTGETVKGYMPGKIPGAENLAEPSTLRPMREVVRRGRPGEAEPPPSEPGKVDPGAIKQMGNISSLLRELKSRREQFVPQNQSVEPSGEAPIVGSEVAEDISPLVQRFDEVREALLQKRGQGLDLEAMRRLVALAGESFPVVTPSDFKMSPGEEPMVMKWVFPGNEILFGFEPEHQFRYWQSLIKLAGRRSESASVGRLKLVVFSEGAQPFSGAASMEEDEMVEARRRYLDVIDLDAGMIASVTAADRVVSEMAKSDEPVLPSDAIRELAVQLDPLWRRITRPLIAEPGVGEAV